MAPKELISALANREPRLDNSCVECQWCLIRTDCHMRQVREADLATFICRLSRNLGASASWKPQGVPKPIMRIVKFRKSWVSDSQLVAHINLCMKS